MVQIKMNSRTSHYMHYRINIYLVSSRFTRLKTIKLDFKLNQSIVYSSDEKRPGENPQGTL
jgi:hypothetical protein